jgi:hypothetical protein
MAEIVDDFKISNVEITNELGINLTSDTSRIKHTGNNEFNISSRGDINIYAGEFSSDSESESDDSDDGRDIRLYAGKGERDGGDIKIHAGDGESDDGGDIYIEAGDGDDDGGDIDIYAGDGDSDGGDIDIYAGDGGDDGGDIDIYAGDGGEDGGSIQIRAGYGNGEEYYAEGEDVYYDHGGDIDIYAGNGRLKGGDFSIRGGNSNVSNSEKNGPAGNVYIYGGTSYGQNAQAGHIQIIAGEDLSSGITGSGGDLFMRAGRSTNGNGGHLTIMSGNGLITAGNIEIRAGDKTGDNTTQGASLYLYGGEASGTAKGGNIELTAGQGSLEYGDIKISDAPDQKIGFFGATPVVQPSTTGITAGCFENGDHVIRLESTFTGDIGDKAYTIGDIVRALKQLGLLDSYTIDPLVAPAAQEVVQPRVVQPRVVKPRVVKPKKTPKEKKTETEDSD